MEDRTPGQSSCSVGMLIAFLSRWIDMS
jgi:hypothetical protein